VIADKSHDINNLQMMSRLICRRVIARKFLDENFYRASPVFSTICDRGNEIAPPASRLPNSKAFRMSNLVANQRVVD
jgi:hypothetical protein